MESANLPQDSEAPDVGEREPSEERFEIFISYSHMDEIEKNRLSKQLGVLEHRGQYRCWADDQIRAGEKWVPEIESALARARIAILLITANYLSSDFIKTHEVPKILERQENGMLVFPILAQSCAWSHVTWLCEIQLRPKHGKPVWRENGIHVNKDLADIVDEIGNIIKDKPVPTQPSVTTSQDYTWWDSPLLKYLLIAGVLLLLVLVAAFLIRVINGSHSSKNTSAPPQRIPFKEWRPNLYGASSLDPKKWDAPTSWKPEYVEGVDPNRKALIITGTDIGLMKIPDDVQRPSDHHVEFEIIVDQGQRSASWIVCAQDKQNYYLFTLTFPMNEHNAFVKGYFYLKGKYEVDLDMVKDRDGDFVGPLPYEPRQPFNKDDIILVKIDVKGGKFSYVIKLTSVEPTKHVPDPTHKTDRTKINDKSGDPVPFTFIDQPVHYSEGLFGFKAESDDKLIIRDVYVKALSDNQ